MSSQPLKQNSSNLTVCSCPHFSLSTHTSLSCLVCCLCDWSVCLPRHHQSINHKNNNLVQCGGQIKTLLELWHQSNVVHNLTSLFVSLIWSCVGLASPKNHLLSPTSTIFVARCEFPSQCCACVAADCLVCVCVRESVLSRYPRVLSVWWSVWSIMLPDSDWPINPLNCFKLTKYRPNISSCDKIDLQSQTVATSQFNCNTKIKTFSSDQKGIITNSISHTNQWDQLTSIKINKKKARCYSSIHSVCMLISVSVCVYVVYSRVYIWLLVDI